MLRFLLRVALLAAALGIGGVALRRWLDEQNASMVGAATPGPPSQPPPIRTAAAPQPPKPDPASGPADSVFASMSRDELYQRAQSAGIKGRSKMSKAELAEAVAQAELGGG